MALCEIAVRDERCPDGCCGDVVVAVKSPKTGRVVACSLRLLGDELAAKLAVWPVPKGYCPEARYDGKGIKDLSRDDLSAILDLDGQYDPC